MNTINANNFAIEQCLQEEIAAMSALSNLLVEEKSALINDDIASLNKTNAHKSDLLRKISELERMRFNHLNANGFSCDQSGMESFLQNTPESVANSKLWEELLAISEQAKQNNNTNGLLITRRLAQNQTALNILQRGNNMGSLYGPNGQSTIKATPTKGVIAG